jgi:hypothetical protein
MMGKFPKIMHFLFQKLLIHPLLSLEILHHPPATMAINDRSRSYVMDLTWSAK